MVTHAERPQFPGPFLIRSQCPDTSLKITLLMKAQHLGALTPLGIVLRNPQVPHTAREVTCHPVNNWRGKQSSIPPHKTRPDTPVRTLQRNCDPSQIWPRGSQERKHEFQQALGDTEGQGSLTCCSLCGCKELGTADLLKKMGKTTRPFRYELSQIPYDHTVEMRNRFKGRDLTSCLMNYGWRFMTFYRRQGSRTSPW